MKRKPPLIAKISQHRIDGLSNDLSEGIASGTVEEWRAVALHFRNQFDRTAQDMASLRTSIAGITIAEKMKYYAMKELSLWLERQPK